MNTWWLARDGAEPPTPAFSVLLCCVLNNLSDFRWPPKYLRSRERHENRGWKSWVQTPLGKGTESFTFLPIHQIEFRKVGIMSSFVRLHPLTSRIRCDLKTIPT